MSKSLIPKSGEVGVAIAFESLVGIWLETDSCVARFLEILHKIKSCISLWFAWIQRVLGELVHCIHDVRPGGRSQIVELADHGSVVEVQGERRLVKMDMQMLVDFGRNSLDFGVLEIRILDDCVN
jgi:hypothetical protein